MVAFPVCNVARSFNFPLEETKSSCYSLFACLSIALVWQRDDESTCQVEVVRRVRINQNVVVDPQVVLKLLNKGDQPGFNEADHLGMARLQMLQAGVLGRPLR